MEHALVALEKELEIDNHIVAGHKLPSSTCGALGLGIFCSSNFTTRNHVANLFETIFQFSVEFLRIQLSLGTFNIITTSQIGDQHSLDLIRKVLHQFLLSSEWTSCSDNDIKRDIHIPGKESTVVDISALSQSLTKGKVWWWIFHCWHASRGNGRIWGWHHWYRGKSLWFHVDGLLLGIATALH